MKTIKEKTTEVYPIFANVKNLKDYLVPGAFCKNLETNEILRISESKKFINQSEEIVNVENPEKNISLLFFCGKSEHPNPDALFKIDGEWLITSAGDLLGEPIEEAHLIFVSPEIVGWNKINDIARKINFDDIKKIIELNSVNVETKDIEIEGNEIIDVAFLVEIPKLLEGKAVFIL